jgi:hypothetical protein
MATIREREASASSSSTNSEQVAQPPVPEKLDDVVTPHLLRQNTNVFDYEGQVAPTAEADVFGNEEGAEVHYKTCKW